MKKLFLTGIAALFLATPAQAQSFGYLCRVGSSSYPIRINEKAVTITW